MMKTVRYIPTQTDKVVAAPAEKQAVTAAPHSIDQTRVCSVCKQPMRAVTANQIPAYVCMNDRVVLPQPELAMRSLTFSTGK